jgi:hypothetical protein
MAKAHYLKRNDTSPALLYYLQPKTVVLTGATVVFNAKNSAGDIVVNRASATIVTADGNPAVQWEPTITDTATAQTLYGEFEVTYSGGAVETFPNKGEIRVVIRADVA